MSLLAPLYFAGALAIGLPILFHMIRRRPRGEVKFSSLMFLRPTPPKLTRRSRLDNWPLLLIRALALLLMAAAFARPYLRSATTADSDLPGRRMVIAVDRSASMQRAGLWDQAKTQVDEVLSDLRPGDEIALVAFDNEPTTLLQFDQTSRLTPAQMRSSVNAALVESAPTWASTDLGRAIAFAADLAVTYEPADRELLSENTSELSTSESSHRSGPATLIVVTDMQVGSNIESLQVFAWPDQLSLDIRRVFSDRRTNASAQVLTMPDSAPETKDGVRIRVSNSASADQSSFRVSWANSGGVELEDSGMPIQVPPGESRVMRMPEPAPGATALKLEGDDHDFDNTWYIVSPQPESLSLLYLGADPSNAGKPDTVSGSDGRPSSMTPNPRSSLLYYLQRVPLNTSRRTVSIESMSPDDLKKVPDSKDVPLVVVTEPCSTDTAGLLREYVRSGGQLLYVLAREDMHEASTVSLRSIAGVDELLINEASVSDYVMLSRINFRHPLFASMSDPQFNDFTKIRFWSHRTLTQLPEKWNILAQFDDGDPALVEQSIGDGTMWVLAAGWQPEASQLALSTKFIPLIFGLFDASKGFPNSGNLFSVGDQLSLEPSPTAEITLPDGQMVAIQNPSDFSTFDQPGIYSIRDGDSTRSMAVNIESAESLTDTIGADALERFGIKLGSTPSTAVELASERQLRDLELEGRQRLWQWLLVAALALLGLETLLGGLLSKSRPAHYPTPIAARFNDAR
ncbi:BatA domain-containing protein [Allorhodopirellula heiligendammensis]|uniref:VWFA domain-containing protein n=1 Tax=Allorhodopirellula heiligendammensis TaxID=2714739 RepID=A0A5C6BFU4_9BACT|nr:BatA domain-containing protein [Allorhodopirellula heiligendammensis]TWU10149.1 hypothetical protein Poly21_51180 [Allorhodopirellula heiligendammensis]